MQERRSGAESARKLIQLLLSFNHQRPSATVKELAEVAGLSLPTAHRYVALLKETGLLEESGRSSYRLGWRVIQLSQTARASDGLAWAAEPVMRRLGEETGETVTLLRLVDDSMVCVGQVESSQIVRLSLELGQRLPLYAGASAKILLAGLEEGTRRAYLDRMSRERPEFARRRDAFEEELREIHRKGWATSQGELDEGIWAASVPVDDGSQTVAALSIEAPEYRVNRRDTDLIVSRLVEAAGEVRGALEA